MPKMSSYRREDATKCGNYASEKDTQKKLGMKGEDTEYWFDKDI
jgi:hypothetical protein